jgi:hypothetical protein
LASPPTATNIIKSITYDTSAYDGRQQHIELLAHAAHEIIVPLVVSDAGAIIDRAISESCGVLDAGAVELALGSVRIPYKLTDTLTEIVARIAPHLLGVLDILAGQNAHLVVCLPPVLRQACALTVAALLDASGVQERVTVYHTLLDHRVPGETSAALALVESA